MPCAPQAAHSHWRPICAVAGHAMTFYESGSQLCCLIVSLASPTIWALMSRWWKLLPSLGSRRKRCISVQATAQALPERARQKFWVAFTPHHDSTGNQQIKKYPATRGIFRRRKDLVTCSCLPCIRQQRESLHPYTRHKCLWAACCSSRKWHAPPEYPFLAQCAEPMRRHHQPWVHSRLPYYDTPHMSH